MPFLKGLNPAQKEAVTHTGGPLLILAGAGSGKTRVLTTRIANLVRNHKVDPGSILAVTFTNKAAAEMRSRVSSLLGASPVHLWLGTFHSIGLRILKTEASKLGLTKGLTIYDDDDQLRLIKIAMEELEINPKTFSPRAALSRINKAKNEDVTPEEFSRSESDYFAEKAASIYALYQKKLKEMGALDFGDLICTPIKLFRSNPEVLEKYQRRFKHVLVDEYQDTNKAQYILMNMIASGQRNLCAVGDPDQSIYKWRGAEIKNILDFEGDWDDATLLKLEQNYRSTKHILAAANSVIEKNLNRHKKSLWTDNTEGSLVRYEECKNEYKEAETVVKKIGVLIRESRLEDTKLSYKDFAVFYRTNAQSRVLEEQFARSAMPYAVLGGMRFYERMEIKDALSYLRVIANPKDALSLKRIVNVPPRGIGTATFSKISEIAREDGSTLYEAFQEAIEKGELKKPTQRKLFDTFEKIKANYKDRPLHEVTLELLEESGYLAMWETQATEEAYARIENLHELISAMKDFEASFENIPNEDGGIETETILSAFLEQVALISDLDSYKNNDDRVTMMTLHSAKGLEFPVVFMVGAEEGLFPHSRSAEDVDELEEERRLCYVGMTRAKERLFILSAGTRTIFGDLRYQTPSRFISEISSDFIEGDEASSATSTEPYYTLDESQLEPPTETKPLIDDYTFDENSENPWRIGMQVRHLSFGIGVVRAKEGQGENTKLTIHFKDAGQKKIIVKYAALSPA